MRCHRCRGSSVKVPPHSSVRLRQRDRTRCSRPSAPLQAGRAKARWLCGSALSGRAKATGWPPSVRTGHDSHCTPTGARAAPVLVGVPLELGLHGLGHPPSVGEAELGEDSAGGREAEILDEGTFSGAPSRPRR